MEREGEWRPTWGWFLRRDSVLAFAIGGFFLLTVVAAFTSRCHQGDREVKALRAEVDALLRLHEYEKVLELLLSYQQGHVRGKVPTTWKPVLTEERNVRKLPERLRGMMEDLRHVIAQRDMKIQEVLNEVRTELQNEPDEERLLSLIERLSCEIIDNPERQWSPLAKEVRELSQEIQQRLKATRETSSDKSAKEATDSLIGWHGKTTPKGIRKAGEKDVYLWSAPAGLEIQMVYVRAGDFIMGRDDGNSSEKPRHMHFMPAGYYIGRYETTWKEYRTFCGATSRSGPESPSWGAEDDHPVVNVSWDDAKAFCDWAGLALPTEAQWEKAGRGTDGRRFPWGNYDCVQARTERGDQVSIDWIWPAQTQITFSPRLEDQPTGTAPVGKYPDGASPCGALDMLGNVWEWCQDWYYDDTYYLRDLGEAAFRSSGTLRSARGEGWRDQKMTVRVTVRAGIRPDSARQDLGFRPVKNID
ncbi:SUMF1/EgtB/PvdO family nonheme iron enzyme [Planctomycetota bacterium]